MRLWREWIPSVWIKPETITAGTMCVEQVQPYVEGMEIKAPEAENENISESTINGTANQAQKVPEMAAAEAQSEVSVVAAQLQIGVVMGTTEQLSAQDSQGNVNTDLAISGAQPELTMGEIETCHGKHDVRFKGQERHRRCTPQTLLQKNGHAGRSLHSVSLRSQIQRCSL